MARCGCLETACQCTIEVVDTDCIDLEISGVGSVVNPYQITANPRIDPDGDNTLECRANGLFVPSSAVNVDDTNCIDLEGDGTPGDPITATPRIDPDGDNILLCRPTGLFVPAPSGTSISVDDTDCIMLSGNGTIPTPLTADLVVNPAVSGCLSCEASGLTLTIDPDPDNLLSCGVSGLIVSSAVSGLDSVDSLDSDCITLSGDGTPGDPLIADLVVDPAVTGCLNCGMDGLTLVVDPDPDNLLSCGASGLVVDCVDVFECVTGTTEFCDVVTGCVGAGEVAYAQVTANQGSITTLVDLTGLSVTLTTLADRRYKITGFTNWFTATNLDRAGLRLTDGSNVLLQRGGVGDLRTTGIVNCAIQLIHTPGAGSRTYKLRGQLENGTGALTMFAASNTPAFILVEDIGPA